MIYVNIYQNDKEAHVSMGGVEKNNTWYDDAILSISNLSYQLSGGIVKVKDFEIEIVKSKLQDAGIDINSRLIVLNIILIENDIPIWGGNGILIDDNELSVTYLCKTIEPSVNLLDPAPDLNNLTNRVYYRAFGKGKFVKPLLLDDVNLKYHGAYGTVQAVYDDGVSVSFTDNGDGTFTLSANPVGEITMDVNSTDSDIIQIAQFVANRIGYTLDSTLANTGYKINYFVNQQVDSLKFLSDACEYTNHVTLLDNLNTTLKVVQLYSDFANVPDEIKLYVDGFRVLRSGLQKRYNDIIKEFKAIWEKRESVANPQRVESQEATKSAFTGLNSGEIIEITPFDYIDSNIESVLWQKYVLYLLHKVELRVSGLDFITYNDFGKVIYIDVPEYLDMTKINWMQIIEMEFDFSNAETILKGQGQLFWR